MMEQFAKDELAQVRRRLDRLQDELDSALKLVERQTQLIEKLLALLDKAVEFEGRVGVG